MKKPVFTPDEEKYLLENIEGKSSTEIIDAIKIKFNKDIVVTQLDSWKHKHKIKSNVSNALFNSIEKKFLMENILNKTSFELAQLFNNEFNRSITPKQIRRWKQNNRIRSEVNTKFKSGKEHLNYKPIGSETTVNVNGKKITFVKIREPNIWERKKRYLYEKNIGKIPEGNRVIFLDGNTNNFNLNNLSLVSKKEQQTMCLFSLYFNDKELTKTGLLITKLKLKSKNVGLNEI